MNKHHKTESKEHTAIDIPADASAETAASAPLDFEAEAAKYKDLALRAQADFDNFRKRTTTEKQEAIRYANMRLLEQLLPVLDNFELGLEAAKSAADTTSIVQGMSMILKQLQDFLQSHGVEAISAEGEPFDPNKHEAVAQEHSEEIPEGKVVRQMRRGYKLKDRLLRPSTVTVSKGSPE